MRIEGFLQSFRRAPRFYIVGADGLGLNYRGAVFSAYVLIDDVWYPYTSLRGIVFSNTFNFLLTHRQLPMKSSVSKSSKAI
jgi:hypothetical protein